MKDAYTILGIELEPSEVSPAVLKYAYRKALLECHPDKLTQANEKIANQKRFTVQEIKEAFSILSDQSRKEEHDKILGMEVVQTGETVDLSDLQENINSESGELFWTKSCRCGNSQGYKVTEIDLLENEDREETTVQCLGCSIWIKVLYSVE